MAYLSGGFWLEPPGWRGARTGRRFSKGADVVTHQPRLVVGISGASGIAYGVRLLSVLRQTPSRPIW